MIVTLEIDNETFNVLQCRYIFHRKVDSKGRPRGGMKDMWMVLYGGACRQAWSSHQVMGRIRERSQHQVQG